MRTGGTLRRMNFGRGGFDGSPFRLSNKRGGEITVTNMLTVGPGVLVLSRPATNLSPGKQSSVLSRVTRLRGMEKVAVVLMSRDVRSVTGCTRELVMIGSKRVTCSSTPGTMFTRCERLRTVKLTTPRVACVVRTLGRGNLSMSMATAAISRTGRGVLTILEGYGPKGLSNSERSISSDRSGGRGTGTRALVDRVRTSLARSKAGRSRSSTPSRSLDVRGRAVSGGSTRRRRGRKKRRM